MTHPTAPTGPLATPPRDATRATTRPGPRRAIRMLAVAAVGLALAACGIVADPEVEAAVPTTPPSHLATADPRGEVLVSAAASLADAFADIEASFEAANPRVDVVVNVAGSSTLREQVLAGAPADVFASADRSNMDRVVAAGLVDDQPVDFVANRLQVTVPAGNPAGIASVEQFADPDLLLGLCAEPMPCGSLARRALDTAGVVAEVDTNEPDVRALVTKLASGELDAGITYATDIIGSDGAVEGIDLPDDVDARTTYPIAVLADAPNHEAATAFVDFVLDDGQKTLADHGFSPP